MLSKKLIGTFMLAGPILAVLSLVLFEPGGDDQTFAQTLQRMSENYTLASISNVAWFVAVMMIFVGIYYLARSMQEENKPGSDLAGLASIFALLIAGIAMVAMGLQLIATERASSWVASGGDALSVFAISEAISRSIFVFDGIVMVLLGLAIIKQKNLSPIVGGLLVFFGACVLFGGMFSQGDNWAGMIWFIGFLGFPLITITIGFLILKSSKENVS